MAKKRLVTKVPVGSRRPAECLDQRSEERTARYVSRRISELTGELADLLPDMRILEHYSEIEDLSCVLRRLQDLRRFYDRVATFGQTDEEDDL